MRTVVVLPAPVMAGNTDLLSACGRAGSLRGYPRAPTSAPGFLRRAGSRRALEHIPQVAEGDRVAGPAQRVDQLVTMPDPAGLHRQRHLDLAEVQPRAGPGG